MSLVTRDRALEVDTLDRIERLSRVDGIAARVLARLDEVEARGGPDVGVASAVDRVRGAHEEAVDGPAWLITAMLKLREDLDGGHLDGFTFDEAAILAQDAMVSFAHAEQALRGVLLLLGERA